MKPRENFNLKEGIYVNHDTEYTTVTVFLQVGALHGSNRT